MCSCGQEFGSSSPESAASDRNLVARTAASADEKRNAVSSFIVCETGRRQVLTVDSKGLEPLEPQQVALLGPCEFYKSSTSSAAQFGVGIPFTAFMR